MPIETGPGQAAEQAAFERGYEVGRRSGALEREVGRGADRAVIRERVKRVGAELANGTYFAGGIGRRGRRPA